MDVYTLPYFKWITSKDLLYSTWNSAQCYVAAWMGGEFGGEWMHEDVWLRTRSFRPFRPAVLETIFWEETLGKASLSACGSRTGKPSISDIDRGSQTQGLCRPLVSSAASSTWPCSPTTPFPRSLYL